MDNSTFEDRETTNISRRATLRALLWITRSAPLLLLAACGSSSVEAPITASAGTPAASSTVPARATVPATAAVTAPTAASPSLAAVATPTSSAVTATSPTVIVAPASPASSSAQASSVATAPAELAAAGMCVLSPEMTEGPYFIEGALTRGDITEGKPGLPLQLSLTVQNASTCRPIAGATVDVWHCDAGGVYSGYAAAQGPGGPGGGTPPAGGPPPGGPPQGTPGAPGAGGGHAQPSNKETFLRGNQQTDASGLAVFTTIYPGWYTGRATHIHLKVHVGGNVVHTGQLFMDDALNDQIYAQAPYAAHGKPDTTNATDGIYASGGAQSMPSIAKQGNGYVATMTLGVKA